jgi:hypothetical protein
VGGNFLVVHVAAFTWTGWQESCGLGGSVHVDWVATFLWTRWQESVEYARGGDLRRFYTKQPKFYGGIDLHARTMSLCILHQDGDLLMHRKRPAGPDAWLKAMAPSREERVVGVACLCTGYGLADLCAREGRPFVLGHALSRQARHGGQAKPDKIDAHNSAGLRRGGLLPQASVSPAEMRAPRALRRRRMPLVRQRAALLTPVPHTTWQSPWPDLGKPSASNAPRGGVAERCPAPAVPKRREVALALIA